MTDFEVLVLGVGDSFSEHYHPTSLLLSASGFHLAIDCPDMYRAVLRAARERSGRTTTVRNIDHVLLTHVHGDHMNGLEGLAFYKHFAEGKRLALACSPEVRAVLWEQRLAVSMGQLHDGKGFVQKSFDDYFDYLPLPWDEPTRIGPFVIQTRRTLHHVPTSALLIEANGARLGYSSDTAFDPGLFEFFASADLIIHETNFGPAHTPYTALALLPEELRERMRLIHYPDVFELEHSAIRALREGEVVRVARGSAQKAPP